MSGPTPDEAFEERLRTAFAAAPQPVVPTSILTTVELLRTDEGSSTRGPQRRRIAMAGVLGLAAVVIAITGVNLLSGATPRILPSSPPPSGSPFFSPGPSAIATPAPEAIRFAGFANRSVGWALTDRGLRLTNDGGQTWLGAGPPVDYAHWAPKGVVFFDLLHGWVVSEDSFTSALTLWRTDNGGEAWSRTTLPPVPMPAETMGDATVVSIDAVHAVIDVRGGMPNGYQDGVLVTADGGATWSSPKMQSAALGADGLTGEPAFLDPKVGWLAGGAPGTRLWATRDGGDSWTLQRLTPPASYREDEGMYLRGPQFYSGTQGVVARSFDNGVSSILVIYRTEDGGRTWLSIDRPMPPASSLSVISATAWILWGGPNGSFWRSTNQGKSWSPAGAAAGLPGGESPVMTDPDHGYVFSQNGAGGTLYVTSNGGSTWTTVKVEPTWIGP